MFGRGNTRSRMNGLASKDGAKMTRETKVGLLVGMGIILLIGIVVSDHLSKVQQQPPANFMDMSRETFDSLITNNRSNTLPSSVSVATPARGTLLERSNPLPLPNEVTTPITPQPSNRIVEETARYNNQPPASNSYAPRANEPRNIPDAQPPIHTRTPQPRRVEDMSEEQAVASRTTRITPPMAVRVEHQPRTTGMYHTVIADENLYVIAKRYYGDGELWRLIRDANPRLVTRDGAIMLGSRLLIPSKQQVRQHQNDATLTQAPVIVQREITVKSGDTLSELAKTHLGSAADWDELLEANRDKLSRPEQLRVGMTLKLPAKAIKRATEQLNQASGNTTTSRQPQPTTTRPKTYTVKSGDTLSSIAAQTLGSANKWYTLYKYNKSTISDPDNLTVGTTIKIPD